MAMDSGAPARVVRGACPHDCPDTCAWRVTVDGGRAVELVGDPDHPFTRGGLCAKVDPYLERVYSPERVLYPLRRVGPKGEGRFERIGWDAALEHVAARLRATIDEHGASAILPYSYMGTQGLVQGSSLDRRFFARLGATRLVRAICGSTGSSGVSAVLGSGTGMLPEDLAHSRFIVLWGTNTLVTNLHQWRFVRQARDAGATLVVIDPQRTRTAAAADWHLRPRPGTDAALALGMMHVIVAEDLHDVAYLRDHTVGFEALQGRLADYPPERVARITGIDRSDVERLARAYATKRPAALRTLVGMEHRAHGGGTYRAIACLPAIVGAWRERGGGLLHMTAALHAAALDRAALERRDLQDPGVRAVNMVQLGRVLTDPDLAPPVKALVVYNSNPAAIAPNQQLVRRGLERDDLFTVVHEQFLTDTARHADIVLPATTQVEHADLMWSWGQRYLALNLPAIAPLGEALPNTELFRRLARRMGFDEPYLQDSDEELMRQALGSGHPYLEGITLERLQRDGWAPLSLPEPWLPFAEGNFPTPSGKCELYVASRAEEGLDPLPAYVPAAESADGSPEHAQRYPLALITAKSALHFLNSSYANLPRHLAAEREPRLDLNPLDAEARGIARWRRRHGAQRPRQRAPARPGRRSRARGRGGHAVGMVAVAEPRRHGGERPHRGRPERRRRRRRLPRHAGAGDPGRARDSLTARDPLRRGRAPSWSMDLGDDAAALRAARLRAQLLAAPGRRSPADVVRHLVAVQAQDARMAPWAIGVRDTSLERGDAAAPLEGTVGAGGLVRTWLFRGTLHLVHVDDLAWLTELVRPRVLAGNARRYRQLELDARTLEAGDEVLRAALVRAPAASAGAGRDELASALERRGIDASGQRLPYLLQHAALRGVLVCGPDSGRTATYAPLPAAAGQSPLGREGSARGDEEAAPRRHPPSHEQAPAALAARYLAGYSPATAKDLSWWAGLTVAAAKAALEDARELGDAELDGLWWWRAPGGGALAARGAGALPRAYLLPPFDPYLLGYRDRSLVLDGAHAKLVNAGGGMVRATAVVDGRIVGTWTRTTKGRVRLTVAPFVELEEPERDALRAAAERWGAFEGTALTVAFGAAP